MSMGTEVRVLAATGCCGSGFKETSFEEGMGRKPHFIERFMHGIAGAGMRELELQQRPGRQRRASALKPDPRRCQPAHRDRPLLRIQHNQKSRRGRLLLQHGNELRDRCGLCRTGCGLRP